MLSRDDISSNKWVRHFHTMHSSPLIVHFVDSICIVTQRVYPNITVPNFMIQGGNISGNNGVGGESIYGGYFDDESFEVPSCNIIVMPIISRASIPSTYHDIAHLSSLLTPLGATQQIIST